MSYSFPLHTSDPPIEGRSSISPSLLTPPLTPRDEHDVPYRPTEADQTSLNMRRKRKNKTEAKTKKESKHSKQRQPIPSSGRLKFQDESFGILQDDLHRSKSLSKLYRAVSGDVSPRADTKKLRRWTLPSKSSATRVFTPLRSTVRQTTLRNENESLAMNTLRHASINKTPKRIELTFFPEPSFGNPKSNLLSYLVSTFSRSTTMKSIRQTDKTTCVESQATRSASIGSNGAYPVSTLPAATVCTEASIESTIVVPGGFVAKSPPPRRCSTRYVTVDSNFEVIWDENDSSTTTQESSRPSLASERRTSIAVKKLEAQLAQSPKDMTWFSGQTWERSGISSPSSADKFFEQALTPEKLAHLLPRLTHVSPLRDLPRSKSGRKEPTSVYNMASEALNCQVMSSHTPRASVQGSDCFPPLRTRGISEAKTDDWTGDKSGHKTQRQQSMTMTAPLCLPRSRVGSMVGSSSHTRRRSSAGSSALRHRGFAGKRRASKLDEGIRGRQIEDETPLLGTT